MDKNDAEKLTASIFQLEQELARGTWDTNKELQELIKFAKSFEENVRRSQKLPASNNQNKSEDKNG